MAQEGSCCFSLPVALKAGRGGSPLLLQAWHTLHTSFHLFLLVSSSRRCRKRMGVMPRSCSMLVRMEDAQRSCVGVEARGSSSQQY